VTSKPPHKSACCINGARIELTPISGIAGEAVGRFAPPGVGDTLCRPARAPDAGLGVLPASWRRAAGAVVLIVYW